jgi:hypothetical protein
VVVVAYVKIRSDVTCDTVKKRGYIIRNARGSILAYHLSMLPGSSGSMILRGDEWVGKGF